VGGRVKAFVPSHSNAGSIARDGRSAQTVGLTLGEILGIVAMRDRGETPCGHVLDLVQARAAEVDQRITELKRLRADLGQLARRAGHSTRPTTTRPEPATSSARAEGSADT
jgi:MerR family copper efflux transcriptional regulator